MDKRSLLLHQNNIPHGHGGCLDPSTVNKMAANHYRLWSSPTSTSWQKHILSSLSQQALSALQLMTKPQWARQRQQQFWESAYPMAAFQCFYQQTPTDLSFAYLDFYSLDLQRPCIRYWSTLDLLQPAHYQRLTAWLHQVYAPWPMPHLFIHFHPKTLGQNSHLNNNQQRTCLALRDWLFTPSAGHAGAEAVIAASPTLINIQLEPASANRVYNQYKLAYDCYQKKTPAIDLIPCGYQDLLLAESQQLLLQASIDNHTPIGLFILEHSQDWGFWHYLIKDKCLYPGFRRQGLGIQLEASLYQYLKHNGLTDPILGAIFKTNQASYQCAQRFNRSLWCTEALLSF